MLLHLRRIKCERLKLSRAGLEKGPDKADVSQVLQLLIDSTREFDISDNKFRSQTMLEILHEASMKSLVRLNLSGNTIDSSCAQKLAIFLSSADCSLAELDISGCSLWVGRPIPIEVLSAGMETGNMSVRALTIGDHYSSIDELLQAFIKKLQRLKCLTVQNTRIIPESLGILIGQNPNIEEVSTFDRWEGGGDLEKFFSSFNSITSESKLTCFTTKYAIFSFQSYTAIPEYSHLLRNIVTLNIEAEHPGPAILHLISQLPNFKFLRNLGLKNCNLGPSECQSLFELFFREWATTVPPDERVSKLYYVSEL